MLGLRVRGAASGCGRFPHLRVFHTSVPNGLVSVYYGDTVRIHTRRSKQESNISLAKKQF